MRALFSKVVYDWVVQRDYPHPTLYIYIYTGASVPICSGLQLGSSVSSLNVH